MAIFSLFLAISSFDSASCQTSILVIALKFYLIQRVREAMIIVGQVTSVTGFVPHLLQFCHPIRSPLHLHSSSVLHRICNKMQRQVSLDEVQCHKRDMQGINLRNVLNGILIYFQFFKNKLCPSCVPNRLKYLLRT